MIELRHRQVLALPPFAAAVVGIPHPPVITNEHSLRIGRIDPDIMRVPVCPLKTTDDRKAPARVFAQNQSAVGFEYAIRIFWIDDKSCEVERTPHHPITFVALVPCHAAIVGNKQRAIG